LKFNYQNLYIQELLILIWMYFCTEVLKTELSVEFSHSLLRRHDGWRKKAARD